MTDPRDTSEFPGSTFSANMGGPSDGASPPGDGGTPQRSNSAGSPLGGRARRSSSILSTTSTQSADDFPTGSRTSPNTFNVKIEGDEGDKCCIDIGIVLNAIQSDMVKQQPKDSQRVKIMAIVKQLLIGGQVTVTLHVHTPVQGHDGSRPTATLGVITWKVPELTSSMDVTTTVQVKTSDRESMAWTHQSKRDATRPPPPEPAPGDSFSLQYAGGGKFGGKLGGDSRPNSTVPAVGQAVGDEPSSTLPVCPDSGPPESTQREPEEPRPHSHRNPAITVRGYQGVVAALVKGDRTVGSLSTRSLCDTFTELRASIMSTKGAYALPRERNLYHQLKAELIRRLESADGNDDRKVRLLHALSSTSDGAKYKDEIAKVERRYEWQKSRLFVSYLGKGGTPVIQFEQMLEQHPGFLKIQYGQAKNGSATAQVFFHNSTDANIARVELNGELIRSGKETFRLVVQMWRPKERSPPFRPPSRPPSHAYAGGYASRDPPSGKRRADEHRYGKRRADSQGNPKGGKRRAVVHDDRSHRLQVDSNGAGPAFTQRERADEHRYGKRRADSQGNPKGGKRRAVVHDDRSHRLQVDSNGAGPAFTQRERAEACLTPEQAAQTLVGMRDSSHPCHPPPVNRHGLHQGDVRYRGHPIHWAGTLQGRHALTRTPDGGAMRRGRGIGPQQPPPQMVPMALLGSIQEEVAPTAPPMRPLQNPPDVRDERAAVRGLRRSGRDHPSTKASDAARKGGY